MALTVVACDSQQYHLQLCMRARVCMCACVCVCVYVRVCKTIQVRVKPIF